MHAGSTSLFSCRDLSITVAGRTLVDSLRLDVPAGELLAILGQNGCGKSLTMHTLAGLRGARNGQVLLDGRDLGETRRQDIARNLALLPQHVDDIFPSTVLDTAMIGRHPHIGRFNWEAPEDYAVANDALDAAAARRPTRS